MVAGVAAGRTQLLKKAGTTIAGVRVTSLAFDDTPIDITSNDSLGVRKLMNVSASSGITITASGVETDGVLYAIAANPATSRLLTDLTFVATGEGTTNDVITGDFFMTNYKLDADYKDAVQFSATFVSSGSWVAA